jgi:lycopene beta-cyclase
MKPYDFVIVGAGAAGLSLAHHLLHSPLRDHSLLILEKDAKERNDRTWCFWTPAGQPTPFDSVVCRTWRQVRFTGEGFAKTLPLGRYHYQMIRGIDLYAYMRAELAAHPNVTLVREEVRHITDAGDHARVMTAEQIYAGRWVFDSRFPSADWRPNPARYHSLRQHFKGWIIETPGAAFDPDTVTFLDFRTPQRGEMRFFYVLPLSERQALVEFVLLSPDRDDQALRAYIEGVLGRRDYRVVAEEGGLNPLTDQPFPRRAGQRGMTIGVRGGMIKPTSGYAFTRIQRDSAAVVRSLLASGHPFDVPASPPVFRLCDSLMLHVMQHHGAQMRGIFSALFKNNPIQRIFRFLDEATTPAENAALIASVPPRPFLQALWQMKVKARWRQT